MTIGPLPPRREPALNIPGVVTALIGLFAVIHLVRVYLLTADQDWSVVLLFSFIPVRYHALEAGIPFPGGGAAEIWSPITYGLLHGDFMHLAVNSIWLAAFGSALAWRFGTVRFLIFTVVATVAGAAAHYLAHPTDFVPVVGASGAISGHMAAVARFMFQSGGPLVGTRNERRRAPVPALPLGRIWRDRRVLAFLGVWFGLNLAFGLGAVGIPGQDGVQIAWEAHVGGFLFGLLAFSLFDPVPKTAPTVRSERRHPADPGVSGESGGDRD